MDLLACLIDCLSISSLAYSSTLTNQIEMSCFSSFKNHHFTRRIASAIVMQTSHAQNAQTLFAISVSLHLNTQTAPTTPDSAPCPAVRRLSCSSSRALTALPLQQGPFKTIAFTPGSIALVAGRYRILISKKVGGKEEQPSKLSALDGSREKSEKCHRMQRW